MRLLTLKIESFKGIQSREIDPKGGNITICGENGTGKTTIVDAYYWLMSGKDSTLTDNPNVIPIGSTECMPTVTATFDMDGKTVTIRKVQRYKNKDGKESTTNQYIVNDVPMTERDFKAKLEEYGIDDRFLVMSHPDYLLKDTSKKGREYVRNKILFPMAQTLANKEIADKVQLPELSEKLDAYTVEEIEAMNRATLKRINDEIGKDNVIANARIDELSKELVEVDKDKAVKELEDAQEALEEAKREAKRNLDAIEESKVRILRLEMDRNALVASQNDEIGKKKRDLEESVFEIEKLLIKANNEAVNVKTEIEVKQETIKTCETRIKRLEEQIASAEKIAKEKADKVGDTCPVCGQKLPADKVEEIKNHALAMVQTDIGEYTVEKYEMEAVIDKTKQEIAELFAKRDEIAKRLKDHEKKIKAIRKEIDSIKIPDVKESQEYIQLTRQIEDIEHDIATLATEKGEDAEYKAHDRILDAELVVKKVENNDRIKAKIADIRSDIRQAEINRANAEKMLYQIECLNKAKNELLEESVNKHFGLVKWKLFRTLKNGNVEDACIPMIDGYEIGTANHGLSVLAKLDIVNGLSRFYGKDYPVFIDNAESLSDCTESRIDIGNQLITMKVTESKELEVM